MTMSDKKKKSAGVKWTEINNTLQVALKDEDEEKYRAYTRIKI
jgi:hypothetical protein